jgi:hypothetical protein
VETEISIKTTTLAKDATSSSGGCPSVHFREGGMAVVQAPGSGTARETRT